MNKTLKSLLIVIPTVLSIGCAATGPDGKPEPSVEQLMVTAEAQMKAAQAAGVLWTTTEKHFETAQKAKADMEVEKAIKAAKKVIKETKLAQEQGKAADQAKPFYN